MKKIAYGVVSCSLVLCITAPGVLAATGSVSSSTTLPQYELSWGSNGSGNGQFAAPFDLSGDGNGHMYVLDADNFRIQEFTTTGTYITQWGSHGSGNGQFNTPPDGIAVGSSGDVYVGDDIHGIQEFTSSGTYVRRFNTDITSPLAIASDRNGHIYVADYINGVVEFNNNGTLVRQWGSRGTGNGQFQDPFGITVAANGNVYVADSYNDRIQEYTSTGTFVTQWGSNGSGNGQFNFPNSVTADSNNNIYVTDFYNYRVQKFTSGGTYVGQWGTQGTGNGQFQDIRGIYDDMNDSDQIYVVDESNGNVQRFGYTNDIATAVAPNGTDNIRLSIPTSSSFTSINSEVAPTNNGYTYPLGLVAFSLKTAPGATVPITLTFQTTLIPSQVSAQKYNTNTQQYQTVPGATITETTLNGQPALQVSYSITDGSSLDEDGAANGIIVDPVGLATVVTTPVTNLSKAPDTGFGAPQNGDNLTQILAASSLVTIGLGCIVSTRLLPARQPKQPVFSLAHPNLGRPSVRLLL